MSAPPLHFSHARPAAAGAGAVSFLSLHTGRDQIRDDLPSRMQIRRAQLGSAGGAVLAALGCGGSGEAEVRPRRFRRCRSAQGGVPRMPGMTRGGLCTDIIGGMAAWVFLLLYREPGSILVQHAMPLAQMGR